MKSFIFGLSDSATTLVTMLVLLGTSSAVGQNIALHKSYALSRPPDYRPCTDPGDAVQLTDGRFTSGRLWTDRGAVGWTWTLPQPVRISLDLESIQPIDGAVYSSAAALDSGVAWPRAIDVFLSVDRKNWAHA